MFFRLYLLHSIKLMMISPLDDVGRPIITLFCDADVFTEPLDFMWNRVGVLLVFLGAFTLVLGIGDVVYTFIALPACQGPNFANTVCVLTIVSAGVWGAIAVCIIALHRNRNCNRIYRTQQ